MKNGKNSFTFDKSIKPTINKSIKSTINKSIKGYDKVILENKRDYSTIDFNM